MTNKTNTREKLIKTASRLFQIKGYSATGLNEILKESGAPKGSLYYHFPNGKEELALEAIRLSSDSIQKKVKKTLDQFEDPIEAIQTNIRDVAKMIEAEKNDDISISLLALETYLLSENLRKACEAAFKALENIYTQKLVQSGFNEIKAQELGLVIQLMVEGAITISLTKKNTKPLIVASNAINDLLRRSS